jgi:hypothetical protein
MVQFTTFSLQVQEKLGRNYNVWFHFIFFGDVRREKRGGVRGEKREKEKKKRTKKIRIKDTKLKRAIIVLKAKFQSANNYNSRAWNL